MRISSNNTQNVTQLEELRVKTTAANEVIKFVTFTCSTGDKAVFLIT